MAGYEPFRIPHQVLHERNMEALAKFRGMGMKLREGFWATGMPHIQFVDLTRAEGEPLDVSWFSQRLHLGNGLLTSGLSPFHADGLHVTLVKWGPGEDDCGRVDCDDSVSLSECSIVSYREVRIGRNVLFGPSVFMFDCDGSPEDPAGARGDARNMRMAPIVIEDNAWIGANAIIMPGVRIGHHATVSTSAVVYEDVAPHCLAAGNPAIIAARFV